MEKYKKIVIPALVLCVFTAFAVPLSAYILSLPLAQIAGENCSGFSGYQLTNCLAYYQRQGGVDLLQYYAQLALGALWLGLLIGAASSFFVFPHIPLRRSLKVCLLSLGLLSALLIAGLPLILFAELIVNGFIFALSLVIGFVALELALASPTKEAGPREGLASSLQGQEPSDRERAVTT